MSDDFLDAMLGRPVVYRDLVIQAIPLEEHEIVSWIERSVTDPEGRGVLVVLERGDEVRHMALDSDVPYGHVYEFRSWSDLRRWRAAGCPG